jgi:V-type H+-transporting ATPase subunit E
MLLASDVTLAHRPKDSDLVKKATESAQGKYKDISGRESKVEYEPSLPDDSAGGVIGSTMAGRIKVDNTLGERLHILEDKVRCAFDVKGRADGEGRCCQSCGVTCLG